MKLNKAYKFRLEPNAEQEIILNNLVGSARFVWNHMLAISFEMFAKNEFVNATNLVNKIVGLKKNPDFAFLKSSSNAVTLQQKVRDLACTLGSKNRDQADARSRTFCCKVTALELDFRKAKSGLFFKPAILLTRLVALINSFLANISNEIASM